MAVEDSHLRSCAVSGGSNIGSLSKKKKTGNIHEGGQGMIAGRKGRRARNVRGEWETR
jgi:hypothetical protein